MLTVLNVLIQCAMNNIDLYIVYDFGKIWIALIGVKYIKVLSVGPKWFTEMVIIVLALLGRVSINLVWFLPISILGSQYCEPRVPF